MRERENTEGVKVRKTVKELEFQSHWGCFEELNTRASQTIVQHHRHFSNPKRKYATEGREWANKRQRVSKRREKEWWRAKRVRETGIEKCAGWDSETRAVKLIQREDTCRVERETNANVQSRSQTSHPIITVCACQAALEVRGEKTNKNNNKNSKNCQ